MKNAIQFLHAALKNRPKERQVKIPKHFIVQMMKGIENQASEILAAEHTVRERGKEITAQQTLGQVYRVEIERLKTEIEQLKIAVLQAETAGPVADSEIQKIA